MYISHIHIHIHMCIHLYLYIYIHTLAMELPAQEDLDEGLRQDHLHDLVCICYDTI